MKKLFVFMVAFCLLSAMAFAEQQGQAGGDGMGGPDLADAGQGDMAQKQARVMDGEGNMARNKEMLQTGLETALSRVTNENARMRLEQNLEKFMQKYQERLERKMQNVTIDDVDNETGAVTIKAREPVKFFGFIKGTATKRFEMDGKGNVNERAPWYSFLYSEDKE